MYIPSRTVRILSIVIISLFFVQCALSPRYRSRPSVYLPAPGNDRETAEKLSDFPSLQTLTGTASWYGPKFHGNKTANGEIYNMNKISAAHKEYPFGTWIRVTNSKNNRILIVRINDRGPFIKGRVLDLSRKAAEELDFLVDGLAKVKIEVLQWGK